MKILKYQQWHLIILIVLLFSVYVLTKFDNTILGGSLLSNLTKYWFLLAILSPIIHQIYVVICWRYELHYKGITKLFGNLGFKLFKLGFGILFASRLITITLLAISNQYTMDFNTTISFSLSVILMMPVVYLFYSVIKYFGIDRAFGSDHFYPEIIKNTPLVNQGIFKYTTNGMYIFGFIMLWIPGILFQSKAALLSALFSHIYIWVHYYFTELPDMKDIYGINENKD